MFDKCTVRRVRALALLMSTVAALSLGTLGNAAAATVPTLSRGGDGPVRFYPNIPYGTSAGEQRADIYAPPVGVGHAPYPVIVMVHGGGFWISLAVPGYGGRAEQPLQSAAVQAANRGYVVVSIDYPAVIPGFPVQARVVDDALDVIRAHAAGLGADPNRIAIWGQSAGATLAATSVMRDHENVKALVAISGAYDLTDMGWNSLGDLTPYVGCLPFWCFPNWLDASPVNHVTAASPPTFVAAYACDLCNVVNLQPQALEFSNVMQANHVRVQTVIVPGSGHMPADATGPALDFLDSIMHP